MATAKRTPRATPFVTKPEFAELRAECLETKHDVRVLKQDVSTLKDDVRVLKDDVSTLKDDVRGLRDEMRAQGVRLENMFTGECRAFLELVEHASRQPLRQTIESPSVNLKTTGAEP